MENMLNSTELSELIEEIKEKIEQEIIKANRTGTLQELLKKYNFYKPEYSHCEPRIAKVLVIGESRPTVDELKRVLKKYGISKDRFEFVLDYDDATNYQMGTLRYNFKYCDIFAGPFGHKTKGMGHCNSILAKIEHNQAEYPKLTRLIANGELKITKNNFEEALKNSQLMELLNIAR